MKEYLSNVRSWLRARSLPARRAMVLVAGIAILVFCLEAFVRIAGLSDFPLYDVDDEIGYIPRPNQTGEFLDRNKWIFNEKSMGAESWRPDIRPNILLIGNSIVMGGDPFNQPDKLGPVVQRRLGERYSVWPIAAGGWTNVNETVYLSRHQEVVRRAQFFVWEYMHGGLGSLSIWRGQYAFPTERPIWATWYDFRRYLLSRIPGLQTDELPPDRTIRPENLRKFAQAIAALGKSVNRRTPGIIFLYPTRPQLLYARQGKEWLPDRAVVEEICRRYGVHLLDIAAQAEWNESYYRPDGVHPTVEGNKVLAGILAKDIRHALGGLGG